MSDKKQEIELDVSGLMWFVVIAFFLFWHQGGWYRIDCALGIQKGCDAISAETEYQPKPAEPSV